MTRDLKIWTKSRSNPLSPYKMWRWILSPKEDDGDGDGDLQKSESTESTQNYSTSDNDDVGIKQSESSRPNETIEVTESVQVSTLSSH